MKTIFSILLFFLCLCLSAQSINDFNLLSTSLNVDEDSLHTDNYVSDDTSHVILIYVKTKDNLEFKKENSKEVDFKVLSGTKIPLYSYNKENGRYSGRYYNRNLQFRDSEIEFFSNKDKEYIKRMGSYNIENRFKASLDIDAVNIKQINDNYISEEQNDKIIKNNLLRNQIFLLGKSYIYSEDMKRFGFRFHIFNCFKKRIKYVYITLSAYNQVDDLQKDELGSSSKKVTCIGPISSHDSGIYCFEDLFWDSKEIISYVCITKISFNYFDGTTKSYAGIDNISKHFAENFKYAFNEDFDFEKSNIIRNNYIPSMSIDEALSSPSCLSGISHSAEFPGGDRAFMNFINKSLKYPDEAVKNNIKGKVVAQFDIMFDGYVDNIRIVNSANALLDKEVIRILKLLPRFKPATNRFGDPLKTTYTLPIHF